MPYPNDIADETERDILERAAHLAAVLEDDWCRPHRAENDRDDVMLLVADLLQSHAATGAALPGRRSLDTAVGAWSAQVRAVTAADAARAAVG